ncbi:TonB family protein [Paucibacter sp. R3-3]|uniref:TonB family protein n=1 Tax=Roseateles agri TaxID=3098619 RepID=A0ABU5DR70_9BURK|nr:TonB family protein [Paucibacter sp. R3-3]MDY0748813.1 TonB family protein [Paucibacter sp. R3-3]
MGSERRRESLALLVSLAIHALLLSLAFGGEGFGLPGFAWNVRRAEVPDLRVVLAPPPAPEAAGSGEPYDVDGTARDTETPRADDAAPASPGAPELIALDHSERPAWTAPSGRGGANQPAAPSSAPVAAAESVEPPPLPRASEPTPPVPAPPSRDEDEQRREQRRQEAVRIEAERLEADRLAAAAAAAARAEAERQEAARVAAAQREAARLDAEREAAARQAAAREAAASAAAATAAAAAREEQIRRQQQQQQQQAAEAARVEAVRQEAARQAAVAASAAAAAEAARQQEQARQAAARQEGERAEAAHQAAAREAEATAAAAAAAAAARATAEAAARAEAARQPTPAQIEAAKREERLRAIVGRQLDAEAAQRDARPSAASSLRRGRLFGRSDANAEMVLYAEAWARKIELNPTFEMVREAAQSPHADALVTVAVRSDGSVESINFVRSSGVPALDEAIRRVIRSQEHYPEFQPALARDYDVIEIRRTWRFDSAIRLF